MKFANRVTQPTFALIIGCYLPLAVANVDLSLPASKMNRQTYMDCVSEDSSARAKTQRASNENNPDRARSFFTEWLFGNNKNTIKSRVAFLWQPDADPRPKIDIITNDKSHNLISLRARTKESLIVVSSASNPMTVESWTFNLNFNLETLIATRVQSNHSGIRGEVFSYECSFEDVEPTITIDQEASSIG